MTESTVGSPVADIVFEEHRILVVLEDGRTLAAPLGWAGPKVLAMDATGRAGWVRTHDGRGVNWPDAGQTSVEGALDVWSLEQDALFEQALADLKTANWDVSALTPRSRSLVALWRLVADGYNGGLLQLLGNWGIAEIQAVLAALAEINATDTLATVREFWQLVGPIAESDEVSTIDDVYAAIDADLSGHLQRLDETFWEVATELLQLIPRAFGPAPSVTRHGHVGDPGPA